MQKNEKKWAGKILAISLALLLALGAIAGCGQGNSTGSVSSADSASSDSAADTATQAPVVETEPEKDDAPAEVQSEDSGAPLLEFSWYVGLNPLPDCQMVNDAVNDYIGPILNMKASIYYWTSKEWEEKMTIMVASGDDLGIIGFGTQSKLDYVIQSRRGSFYPLNDLLPSHGPGTYSLFSKEVWDSIKIDGNIYGIPSLKDNCYIISMIYNADMADELGIDMSQANYKNFATIEPFLNMVQEKKNEVYGETEEPLSGGLGLEMPYWFALETFLQDSNMIVCNIEGIMDIAGYDAHTVFNLYATQEYRDACKAMQRMVDKNILAYDYEGKTAWNASGNMFCWPGWGYTYMPENLFTDDFTTKMIEPVRVWTDTNNYMSAGTAISANAKNPERLMEFLEMVNNDSFLATMLRFGVEDQHYIRDSEGKMHFEGSPRNSDNANPGYRYWYAAPLGNLLIVEAPEAYTGPDGIMLKKMKAFNDNAKLPSHMGFAFDIEPVSTEIAACTSVVLEYRDMLRNGRLGSEDEVDAVVDEFIDKLEANGVQAVINEAQRQIEVWKAS